MTTPQPAHVRLFTADLPSQEDWPRWYYQDLHGELQGPFDAATMSRWCGENALPLDLKCAGIHPQDCVVPPTNIAHLQPLQKLLDNAEAGIRYTPLRLVKGTLSDEGPATPQGAPAKGSRSGPPGAQGLPQQPLPGATDVTRAVDQRLSAAGAVPALTAQQLHMQGQGLLQQLQQNMQNRQQLPQQRGPPVSPAATRQQPQQQQGGRANNARRSNNAALPSPSLSLHEQHMHMMQQAAAAASVSPDGAADGPAAIPAIAPGGSDWNDSLLKLLNRDGFTGKDADVKWRVIVTSGDRVGPFSSDQMRDWLLNGMPPKGVNKQQAQQHAAEPAALQLAGIISADYNPQRLPGAKFFKPLGQLVPAVAAGMAYTAVNKHDLQRGIPQPGWNDGAGKGPAAAAAAVPGKGPTNQQVGGKGAKGRNNAAGGPGAPAAGNSRGPLAGRNSQQQGPGPRPRSAAGAAAAAAAAAGLGLGGNDSSPAAPKPAFQHPMALRQQQRQQQQEEMNAAAAAAATDAVISGFKGQQGMQQMRGPGSAGPGMQVAGMPGPKGFGNANRQNAAGVGSASRGILMAANSMGNAAAAAQQQQLSQAAAAQAAAFAAAAGRLGQAGFAQLQQQQQLQLQMQGLTVGTPTAAYAQSMQQAMWLKQQQQQQQQQQQPLPGQALLASYQGPNASGVGPGSDANSATAAAMLPGHLIPNGALPRTSSTGSSAVQQQQYGMAGQPGRSDPAAAAAAPHSNAILAQAAVSLFLQDHQQQQQLGAAAADRPQTKWWVQRGERAFAGPYTGPQMYQTYLQPTPGTVRFTDSTLIAAISSQVNSRDVPPAKAFVPLGALLEAALQGYCLVPASKDPSMQQMPVQVRHMATGMVVPLQQIVPSVLPHPQQQQQRGQPQSPHIGQDVKEGINNSSNGTQQHKAAAAAAGAMHGGVSPAASHGGSSSRGGSAVPPSPQAARSAATAQQPQFIPAPGGGFVTIAPGGGVPAAAAAAMLPGGGGMGGISPMGAVLGLGGMLAGPGMGPPLVSAAAAVASDPLSMAAALFTSSSSYLWFIMQPATEPQAAPRTTGPHEPTEMLNMFKDGRLQLNSMVSGVHRALLGQQQPQQQRFEPLQLLLASHLAQQQQQQQQQINAAAVMNAAAAGGPMGHMVPAFVPGTQLGPMLVPVSGQGGQSGQLMAVPAGMQLPMQQLQQMQMMPQMQAMAPFLQQGGILVPQPMIAPVNMSAAAQQHSGGDAGSTHGSSSSNVVSASGLAAAAAAQNGNGSVRSGAAPPRVDTWGSLAAAQELAQKRISTGSGSSNQHQLQQQQMQQQSLQQQMSLGAQTVEAALAASSRRTSADSFHSQAGHAAALLWQQQQQQQGLFAGPRSSSSFTQFPYQQQQPGLMIRRTSSGSGRNISGGPASSNGVDSAAAAAAAVAAALGHSAGLPGVGGTGAFGLQMQLQYPQQIANMGSIPEDQQQQRQQQQGLEQQIAAHQGSPAGSAGMEPAAADVAGDGCSEGSVGVLDATVGEPVAA